MTGPDPSGRSAHQPALDPEIDVPGGPSRTIGEVLAQLRPHFPELTISKIRFYEASGLLTPQRTPSGYRKFSGNDVARLRYILTAARDHYLPLKVIRAQLEALDRGETPTAAAQHGLDLADDDGGGSDSAGGAASSGHTPPAEDLDAELRPESFDATPSELRLSRPELLRASGLSSDQLAELEQFGLVSARAGSSYFNGDALLIAKIVAQMSRFGLEARHLREGGRGPRGRPRRADREPDVPAACARRPGPGRRICPGARVALGAAARRPRRCRPALRPARLRTSLRLRRRLPRQTGAPDAPGPAGR
jgi:DNA-binding transcriptional MerR regulator